VHPGATGVYEPTEEELVRLAADAKVVAIGETGLDYYRNPSDPNGQGERFRRHIRAAKRSGKPLIVHSRHAREDTLRILAEEGADAVGGVMHCFAEDWPTALRAMHLGFYISLSGIVTFPKTSELQEVARRLPIDRLLIETDAPYLAPVPHRGKQNHPGYVRYVAERIAGLRGIDAELIGEATTANFRELFRLPLAGVAA
jgi:TatD DNase family protein